MSNGGFVRGVVSEIRSIRNRISTLARWSFESSEEDLPPAPRPLPGPPHGPIPAIDLRRDPHRGEVPRSGGVPPS